MIKFRTSSAEPVQCPIMRGALADWPGIRLARSRQLIYFSIIPHPNRSHIDARF